jgi:hypothetical protein
MTHGTMAQVGMRTLRTAFVLGLLGISSSRPQAQQPDVAEPFAPGEVLSYKAVSGRFGAFGNAVMRVDGPVEMRGQSALQLSFDFRGRVGIFKVEDRSRSWITSDAFTSLRYERHEKSPLGNRSEQVEIFPAELRWEGTNGKSGDTPCEHPLDELSFIYFLRTLPLVDGEEYSLTHHFDPGRNPVRLKVLGRERIKVPAGEFETVVVEMRVSDERITAMRLYFSDDAARLPVRIESSAPWVGTTRLLLQSVSQGEVAAK